MPVERIHWDKQDVVTCDERGRATLGSEYANEQVFVHVSELPEPDELERPTDEEREELSSMAVWATENVEGWIDLDPKTGIVTDRYGEERQSPYGLENGGTQDGGQ